MNSQHSLWLLAVPGSSPWFCIVKPHSGLRSVYSMAFYRIIRNNNYSTHTGPATDGTWITKIKNLSRIGASLKKNKKQTKKPFPLNLLYMEVNTAMQMTWGTEICSCRAKIKQWFPPWKKTKLQGVQMRKLMAQHGASNTLTCIF